MDPARERFHEDEWLYLEKSAVSEEAHVDERWLVSYADMMTLLFGFFCDAYAMADKFDVIQKSAMQQFADKQTHATESTNTPKSETAANLDVLKESASSSWFVSVNLSWTSNMRDKKLLKTRVPPIRTRR